LNCEEKVEGCVVCERDGEKVKLFVANGRKELRVNINTRETTYRLNDQVAASPT
jgi:hypothetical protein